MVPVAGHALRERVHRGEHGQRGEAVGVPVEGGEQVAPTLHIIDREQQKVARCDGDRGVKRRHDLLSVLDHGGDIKIAAREQDQAVLVARAVDGVAGRDVVARG